MKRKIILTSLAAIVVLAVPTQAATILFEQSFNSANPGTTNLDTTTPTTTMGTTPWIAAPAFKTNGTFSGTGSATINLVPEQGMVYTLDVSFGATSANGSWVAFGFANGQGTGTTNSYRFTSENPNIVEGRAWGIIRRTGVANTNQTYIKGGAGLDWTNLTNQDSPVDVRVVLDTTLGDNLWTTTMYARTGTDPYSLIRSETGLGAFDDINSVGFSTAGTTASVSYFKVSVVPEPSSALLLGLAGLLLARRRR